MVPEDYPTRSSSRFSQKDGKIMHFSSPVNRTLYEKMPGCVFFKSEPHPEGHGSIITAAFSKPAQ